jgi:hypothetical protein
VHGFLIVDVMVMKGARVQEHGISLYSYIGIVNRVEQYVKKAFRATRIMILTRCSPESSSGHMHNSILFTARR